MLSCSKTIPTSDGKRNVRNAQEAESRHVRKTTQTKSVNCKCGQRRHALASQTAHEGKNKDRRRGTITNTCTRWTSTPLVDITALSAHSSIGTANRSHHADANVGEDGKTGRYCSARVATGEREDGRSCRARQARQLWLSAWPSGTCRDLLVVVVSSVNTG